MKGSPVRILLAIVPILRIALIHEMAVPSRWGGDTAWVFELDASPCPARIAPEHGRDRLPCRVADY
ncbi:hypothetical protein GCM10027295_36510 [Pseudaeromonas pectinilytica]